MELDIRTLAIVATFSSVLMALSLAALWWVGRSERATVYWLVGAVSMALGFLLIGFRHIIDPAWSIIVANAAILSGYCLHYVGIQVFVGRPANGKSLLFLIGLVAASFVFFTYIEPNTTARIAIISWSVAIVTGAATATLIAEIRKEFSVPEAFVAFSLLLYTLFMTARGAYSLSEVTIGDFLQAGTMHAIAFILIMLLSITLSIGYSVMITGRLNKELRKKNVELDFQRRALDEHAIVSIINTERQITYVNEKFSDVSGYSREELIGQSTNLLRSGFHSAEFYEQLWDSLDGGNTWQGEFRHKSKTGQLYWSRATIHPLLDEKKELQGYVYIGTDITFRKELEFALSQAQSIANFGSWSVDIASNRMVWSDELYRIVGVDMDSFEPSASAYLECIHPDDLTAVKAAYNASTEAKTTFDAEYRLIDRKTGMIRWVHEKCIHETSASGSILRSVGTVHDITSRKGTEQSLEATSNRLQTILETASDGIHILDPKGNVLEFSNSFAQMLGYTVEEAAKLNVADWEGTIPTDSLADTIEHLIHNPATFETKHRRKDGSEYDAEISATGVQFDGQLYLYASCRDISDRKEAENELRQRTEDLELSNATLERQTQEMVQIAEELSAAKEVAEKLAVTDRLTGLFNRLKLDQAFASEYKRCLRYAHPLSVVIFDLDHFKSVNDTFGHQVGDDVLVAVAGILQECVRTVDIAGRWGGEEFLVISPDTDALGAGKLAEKIRERIEAHNFNGVGHKTASFGVAEYTEGDTIDILTSRADTALYRAKTAGRNRVETG